MPMDAAPAQDAEGAAMSDGRTAASGAESSIKKLPHGPDARVRALWEEVFAEDTSRFLDYYDACVTPTNRIYVDEKDGEVLSMLHRNPYEVYLGSKTADVSYIVAVATKEAYRHQGRMAGLLQKALSDSYKEKEPFVYLMPASQEIYRPFGFRTVAFQSVITLGGVFETGRSGTPLLERDAQRDGLSCRRASYDELGKLAEFSERCLAGTCAVYTRRTTAYFERMWKEQEAVEGEILLFHWDGCLAGYCFCGREDGAEVWEPVIEPPTAQMYAQMLRALTRYFQRELPLKIGGLLPGAQPEGIAAKEISYRPMTMVRLTNLHELAKRLCAPKETEITLRIRDELLPQNNGTFRLTVNASGGRLTAVQDDKNCASVSVEELTDALFGIRSSGGIRKSGIRLLRPVYLNELV